MKQSPLNITAQLNDYPASGGNTPMFCLMPFKSAVSLLLHDTNLTSSLSMKCVDQAPPSPTLFTLENGTITGPGGITATLSTLPVSDFDFF